MFETQNRGSFVWEVLATACSKDSGGLGQAKLPSALLHPLATQTKGILSGFPSPPGAHSSTSCLIDQAKMTQSREVSSGFISSKKNGGR